MWLELRAPCCLLEQLNKLPQLKLIRARLIWCNPLLSDVCWINVLLLKKESLAQNWATGPFFFFFFYRNVWRPSCMRRVYWRTTIQANLRIIDLNFYIFFFLNVFIYLNISYNKLEPFIWWNMNDNLDLMCVKCRFQSCFVETSTFRSVKLKMLKLKKKK